MPSIFIGSKAKNGNKKVFEKRLDLDLQVYFLVFLLSRNWAFRFRYSTLTRSEKFGCVEIAIRSAQREIEGKALEKFHISELLSSVIIPKTIIELFTFFPQSRIQSKIRKVNSMQENVKSF